MWRRMQSDANPSLPANWEMQGVFDEMQGGVKLNSAKIDQISVAWDEASLLVEQGGYNF